MRLLDGADLTAVAKPRMEGDYGYLRPSPFNDGATAPASIAPRDLEARNPSMNGLVPDLRNAAGYRTLLVFASIETVS